MNKTKRVFKEAVDSYNNLVETIETLYNTITIVNPLPYSKQDVLENFDLFMQCFLVKVALADEDFVDIELEFLQKVVRYKDHFQKIRESTQNTKELRDNLQEYADRNIKEVPFFIFLFAFVDQRQALDHQQIKSFSMIAFTNLMNLVNSITYIDGVKKEEETNMAANILAPILSYWDDHHIDFYQTQVD